MDKITELTKRDIIDVLQNGFVSIDEEIKYDYYERQYLQEHEVEYKISIYGRLTEIEFLSRIYNLDEMVSYDRRYRNARGDIAQHTINNDDWEKNWVFNDDRFGILAGGDDETFLRFVCEVFHPVVRIDAQPWHKVLDKVNEMLEYDGYMIYPKEHISGREVYSWKEIESNCIEVENETNKSNFNLTLIGEGSYALVYKFKDEFYNENFVLKRAKKGLVEKELERFKEEFTQLNNLNSPYIVKVFNYNNIKNEYIMEYMNYNLEEYIEKNNGKLSIRERKNLVYQVLRAFKYIHSKGLLHRDISPKNVLLKVYDDVNIVKISDFGLVKIPDSNLTSMNTEIKGYFNDPNLQLEGFYSYSMLHETFAITRLIYYIMTGKTNIDKINNQSIREFVNKGMNIDKTKRFKNVEEIEIAFVNIRDFD